MEEGECSERGFLSFASAYKVHGDMEKDSILGWHTDSCKRTWLHLCMADQTESWWRRDLSWEGKELLL